MHYCYFVDFSFQVTAASFNDTSDQVISGGIDNEIKVLNIFLTIILN